MIDVLEPTDIGGVVNRLPVIDVRSPLEFSRGHLPGARNVYIFDDDERALLGYLYVKKNPEEAIRKGTELANGRLNQYLTATEEIAPQHEVAVYCWRGGMRSHSFAELLSQNGFRVHLLKGGYKAYRQHLLQSFAQPLSLIVLGGMTGSGKTRLLRRLAVAGVQVLDLEGLACHKGSVFGAMSQESQPTSQQFENNLFEALSRFRKDQLIVVEDENLDLGAVRLPFTLWQQMREAPLLQLTIPRASRIRALIAEYSAVDDDLLLAGIKRLERRLGLEKAQQAIDAVQNANYLLATDLLLTYYDASYLASIRKRDASTVYTIDLSGEEREDDVLRLIQTIRRIVRENARRTPQR